MKIFDFSGLINLNKLKTSQNGKKNIGFKTGDIIEGKILEIKGQALTLMIDTGKLVRLQDMESHQHQIGDALKMELVKEGEILMGKVMEMPEEPLVKEDLTESALKEIGLESTEDRKAVAKLLRMNSMPITKENVIALTEAKKYIGRLSDLVKNDLIDAGKLPIDKNIKTILVEHLNKSSDLYQSQDLKDQMTVKELMNSEVALSKSESEKGQEAPKLQTENLMKAEKPENTVPMANTYLSEKLDKVEYKSLVFNLKHNVENTVKNLVLLDKVILGSDSVTKQLERFSKNIDYIFTKSDISLKSHPVLTNLLNEFEEISLRDFDKFEKTAEKLMEALKSEPELTSIDKDVLSGQIQTIKSSLSYLNDMSQNLVFVQMPVQLNDQVQNMDLYIKKNPKKKDIDPNHCSIFLSLDTENCHTVKTLLEVNRDVASITFKLKDEEMVAYFQEHLTLLEETLKDKGYHNALINAIEFKQNEDHVLEGEEDYSDHVIDVKL